jgi:hypothetical protein
MRHQDAMILPLTLLVFPIAALGQLLGFVAYPFILGWRLGLREGEKFWGLEGFNILAQEKEQGK